MKSYTLTIIFFHLFLYSCSSQESNKTENFKIVNEGETAILTVDPPDKNSDIDEDIIRVNLLQEQIGKAYALNDTILMLKLAKESFSIAKEAPYSFTIYHIYKMSNNSDSSSYYLNLSKILLEEKFNHWMKPCQLTFDLKLYIEILCLLDEKQKMVEFIKKISCEDLKIQEEIKGAVKTYCD